MAEAQFSEAIAEHAWIVRYRLHEDGHVHEPSIKDTWNRVAMALSAPQQHQRDIWLGRFKSALVTFHFIPAGRFVAGAGMRRRATLFNCFVSGPIHDPIQSIFSVLGGSMVTMQVGGGIGCDFSQLRPAGMQAKQTGNTASGPVSFLHVWNQAYAALASRGARRGAMMATLRCDHPGIEEFIQAQRHVRSADGEIRRVPAHDYAWAHFHKRHGDKASLPAYFVESTDIDPSAKLMLQSVLQSYVDHSISKTVNLPEEADFEQYGGIFETAYQLGLKGCTVFRINSAKGNVLEQFGLHEDFKACP